jgi:hypothetical protein
MRGSPDLRAQSTPDGTPRYTAHVACNARLVQARVDDADTRRADARIARRTRLVDAWIPRPWARRADTRRGCHTGAWRADADTGIDRHGGTGETRDHGRCQHYQADAMPSFMCHVGLSSTMDLAVLLV